jgi:Chromo (CHRromatin Organisation MOdifier) domain
LVICRAALAEDEYEVEALIDHVTYTDGSGVVRQQFLVKWLGYDELSAVPLSNLNCDDLLAEYWKRVGGGSKECPVTISC